MVVIHCPYHSDTLPDVSDTLPRHLSALPPPPNSTVDPTSCLNCSIIWGGALSYSYFLLTPTFPHTLAYPCTPMLTSCLNCSITLSLSLHYEQAKEWLWMWRRASFFSQRSNFFVFKRPSDDWILPSNLASNLAPLRHHVMIGFCQITLCIRVTT